MASNNSMALLVLFVHGVFRKAAETAYKEQCTPLSAEIVRHLASLAHGGNLHRVSSRRRCCGHWSLELRIPCWTAERVSGVSTKA